MDPDETLRQFMTAVERAGSEQSLGPSFVIEHLWDAVEAAGHLIEWLAKGGRAPAWPKEFQN
jgi:hypothetical protein